jgi:hypothetical protein
MRHKNLKIMQKNRIIKISFSLLMMAFITFSACKKTEEVSEQENINVLKIKIGGAIYTWSDTDGAGGTLPKIDTIRLTPNGSFVADLTVQDGSTNPVKDFTPEIIAEKNDHLFIYKPVGVNLTVTDLSKDSQGKDFGQTATFKTGAASSGTVQISLKHLADKNASDPSKTGETDLDVVFPVVIK